jgi:hypothetical protein
LSYFDEVLDLHKGRFVGYRALVVLDDKPLRRLVMCWGPQLVRRYNEYPLDNTMADLWDCVKVDYQALVDLTGQPLPEVMGYFRQAQGMQLIYPDGSVAFAVVDVLNSKLEEIRSN